MAKQSGTTPNLRYWLHGTNVEMQNIQGMVLSDICNFAHLLWMSDVCNNSWHHCVYMSVYGKQHCEWLW